MKYNDSVAQSAEYLRLALPLMSAQAAAMHPVSYAVWYEYVSGRNAALRSAVDALLRSGGKLDEMAINTLFRNHISEIDEATAQRVSEGFQKVMADMSHSAVQAGDQADQFGNALERWCADVGAATPDARPDFEALLGMTRSMQSSVSSLRTRLDDSRREIEQLRAEVSKARQDALGDGLTGLTNRRGFDLALSACLADQDGAHQGPSLLLTDIDHFKRVNDSYGHLFGDKVLRSVAQILKDNVKGKDTAARYGGEEFVILLPDTPLDGAQHLAEKIRVAVSKFRIKRAEEVVSNITVSLGVASFKPGESPADFVGRADAALYAAKNGGRNRVSIATA